MSDLYTPPVIAQIPGLQAALDAHTASLALKAPLASPSFTTALSVAGGTKVANAPILNLSETWNNAAVAFTGIFFNATDTASASGSKLVDLQVGGASAFNVTKAGNSTLLGTLTADGFSAVNSSIVGAGGGLGIRSGGGELTSTAGIRWSGNSNWYDTKDLGLHRVAAGVLGVNNGTAGTYRDLRLRALLDTNGAQVVGTRGAAVADATDAASAITQLNALLARLRATGGHGLIAD
jgi:hypothetical protein